MRSRFHVGADHPRRIVSSKVVETKGLHLKDNAKTEYVRKVFDLCTRQAKSRNWTQLGLEMKDKVLRFEVLAEEGRDWPGNAGG